MAIQNDNAGEKVKETVFERHHHTALRDDDAPQLKTDLDGNGKSLKGIKNVECETINGKDFVALFQVALQDLRGICENLYAQKGHSHPEFKELRTYIDRCIVGLPQGNYAPAEHSHTLKDLAGTLPIAKLENGVFLARLLARTLADAQHDHPELKKDITSLTRRLDALDIPNAYDDGPVWKAVNELTMLVTNRKPQPVVEVQITPVETPRVTCKAEYLILESQPDNATVRDAAGTEGKVRVTERGGQFLARAVFTASPVQPLTFSFSSPPTLCAIGSSTDESTS